MELHIKMHLIVSLIMMSLLSSWLNNGETEFYQIINLAPKKCYVALLIDSLW